MNVKEVYRKAFVDGDVASLRFLLARGFDPSIKDSLGFRFACKNGHTKVVEELLKDGRCDPTACNQDSLTNASALGHIDIVRLLLDDGRADPSFWDYYALRFACEQNRADVVRVLLDDHRVVMHDAYWTLHCAAFKHHVEVTCAFLTHPRVYDHFVGGGFDDFSWFRRRDQFPDGAFWFEREVLPLICDHPTACFRWSDYPHAFASYKGTALALAWCMKSIGNGWADVVEIATPRLLRAPLTIVIPKATFRQLTGMTQATAGASIGALIAVCIATFVGMMLFATKIK